jgi:lipopolysaccharide/colanic/teichoic acid biosynthesis glycosyltransferase
VYTRYVKRLLDLLCALVLLLPVLLVTAICAVFIVLEDRGPVFYMADRMGRDHKPFRMYKLRSMYVNSPDLRMADGSTYNAADDPRMTRVGAFIRKTSIDELPQVLNILRGDMSLIGPRPDDLHEATLYQGRDAEKLRVRPGITGYAQVYGRNAIEWRDRLTLDVEYVDKISFLLDVKIFFRTFGVVFGQQDVYVQQASTTEDDAAGAGSGGDASSIDDASRESDAGLASGASEGTAGSNNASMCTAPADDSEDNQ